MRNMRYRDYDKEMNWAQKYVYLLIIHFTLNRRFLQKTV